MIFHPFDFDLVLNGLRDQGQNAPADLPRRRAGLIQRRLCIEVAQKLKRQLIVVIESRSQSQPCAHEIAHAVHDGICEPFAEAVVVQFL
jgi:hypothetical protein